MGINLGAIQPITPDQTSIGGQASAPVAPTVPVQNLVQEIPNAQGGLTLNLSKGLSLDLTKVAPTLKRIEIGLGWDSVSGQPVDLDVFALTLRNGKVQSGADVIFFNNLTGAGVTLSGDNQTGEGSGDDETVTIDPSMLAPGVDSIAVFVNAYKPGVNFGMIKQAYVRLLDADTKEEKCIYLLNEEAGTYNAFHFATINVKNGTLSFNTIGQPTNGNIMEIANRFV